MKVAAILILIVLMPLNAGAENLALNALPNSISFDPPTTDGRPLIASYFNTDENAKALCATVGQELLSYNRESQWLPSNVEHWTLMNKNFIVERVGNLGTHADVITKVFCRAPIESSCKVK